MANEIQGTAVLVWYDGFKMKHRVYGEQDDLVKCVEQFKEKHPSRVFKVFVINWGGQTLHWMEQDDA